MAVPWITWSEEEFPKGTRRKTMEMHAGQKPNTNYFVRHFSRTVKIWGRLGACGRERRGIKVQSHGGVHDSIGFSSKNWKALECPGATDWLNKLWAVHSMELYTRL